MTFFNKKHSPLTRIKIAKTTDEKSLSNSRKHQKLYIVGGLVSSLGGSMGMAQAMKHRNAKLYAKIKSKSDVPIRNVKHPSFKGNAAFIPESTLEKGNSGFAKSFRKTKKDALKQLGVKYKPNMIIIGKGANNPAVLAHEMGHASLNKNILGRIIQSTPGRLAFKGTNALPALGIGLATGASKNEKTREYGKYAPAILAAPTLVSEAGASLSGLHKIHKAGGKGKDLLNAGLVLLPAFGTYAGKTLMGVGLAHAGSNLIADVRLQQKKLDKPKHKKIASVGPIPRKKTLIDNVQEKRTQREFKSLDEHDNCTEATKTADYIRGDLDKIKPHKHLIQRSTIENTFNTNDQIGEELGLGDPPYTQPHGSEKTAFSNPLAGGSSPVGFGTGKLEALGAPKLPKLPGLQSQKPPGFELRQNITNQSHGLLGSNSMLSRAARGTDVPTMPNMTG